MVDAQVQWIRKRIAELTEDIKAPRRQLVHINQLIDSLVVVFRGKLRREDITIRGNYQHGLPALLLDEAELKAVCHNLLTNAIKAIRKSEKGHGLVVVSTGIEEIDGIEYLRIAVQDNGSGIKAEDQRKIFETSFSAFGDGSGMGLLLDRRIIAGYGGKMVSRLYRARGRP